MHPAGPRQGEVRATWNLWIKERLDSSNSIKSMEVPFPEAASESILPADPTQPSGRGGLPEITFDPADWPARLSGPTHLPSPPFL
jgi:hypothetical protein